MIANTLVLLSVVAVAVAIVIPTDPIGPIHPIDPLPPILVSNFTHAVAPTPIEIVCEMKRPALRTLISTFPLLQIVSYSQQEAILYQAEIFSSAIARNFTARRDSIAR